MALIICDKNLQYQQNLVRRRIAILELWTNHRPTLEKYFSYIREAAESMQQESIARSTSRASHVREDAPRHKLF